MRVWRYRHGRYRSKTDFSWKISSLLSICDFSRSTSPYAPFPASAYTTTYPTHLMNAATPLTPHVSII